MTRGATDREIVTCAREPGGICSRVGILAGASLPGIARCERADAAVCRITTSLPVSNREPT